MRAYSSQPLVLTFDDDHDHMSCTKDWNMEQRGWAENRRGGGKSQGGLGVWCISFFLSLTTVCKQMATKFNPLVSMVLINKSSAMYLF